MKCCLTRCPYDGMVNEMSPRQKKIHIHINTHQEMTWLLGCLITFNLPDFRMSKSLSTKLSFFSIFSPHLTLSLFGQPPSSNPISCPIIFYLTLKQTFTHLTILNPNGTSSVSCRYVSTGYLFLACLIYTHSITLLSHYL